MSPRPTHPHADPNALRLVFWELTARCNLRCQHCRAEAQSDADEGELSTDEIFKVGDAIREVADPIMILTGGEPLVRPDIFDIAARFSEQFSRVALATNGTLVNDIMAQRIVASGIQRVSISLDGATDATHDSFRGLAGSFDAALAGFDALRKANLPVQVNMTLTRHNEKELEDLFDLSLAHGADAFHIFMLVPVGCGAEISDDQRLPPDRFEAALRWLFEQSLAYQDKLHIKATCAPQYYRIMHQVSKERGIPLLKRTHGVHAMTRGCLAGSSVCFISRTGDVQPCGYLPIAAGNVRTTPFGSIWKSSSLFETLRDPSKLKGKCGACGYKVVCEGCRARAYAETGDFMTEEPDCLYQPPAPGPTSP